MVPVPSRTSVGIDLGTTNTKVALVELDTGAVRATAATATPEPAAVPATLRELLGRVLDGAAEAPDAVGIASMAETGVPLDVDGRPLGGWLRWDGHRARAQADELARPPGRAALGAPTRRRPRAQP